LPPLFLCRKLAGETIFFPFLPYQILEISSTMPFSATRKSNIRGPSPCQRSQDVYRLCQILPGHRRSRRRWYSFRQHRNQANFSRNCFVIRRRGATRAVLLYRERHQMKLDRESLLSAVALKTETVTLPQGEVVVSELSSTGYMSIYESPLVKNEKGEDSGIRRKNLMII